MTIAKLFSIGFAVFLVIALGGSIIFGIVQAEAEASGDVALGPLLVVGTQHDDDADELSLGPGIVAVGVLGGVANAATGFVARRRVGATGDLPPADST